MTIGRWLRRTVLGGTAVAAVGTAGFLLVARQAIGDEHSSFRPGDWTIFFPSRAVSRAWGAFARTEFPAWIQLPMLRLYSTAFGCNLEEMEKPLGEYRSLADFFTRSLRPNLRPVDAAVEMTSPVDGRIAALGVYDPPSRRAIVQTSESHSELAKVESADTADEVRIHQVKGVDYSLKALLCEERAWRVPPNHRLYYVVLYLAPGDYHGFHAPTDCHFHMRKHIYGQLLPVWSLFARSVPGLFALNERVVLEGQWAHGKIAYVAVGATNVGSIQLEFDPSLRTNQKGAERFRKHLRRVWGWSQDRAAVHNVQEIDEEDVFPLEASCKKGDRIGFFHLGSTVVMVFDGPPGLEFLAQENDRVWLGQALAAVRRTPTGA